MEARHGKKRFIYLLFIIYGKKKQNSIQTRELIEPIDGFHMNQIANALIADEYWSLLTTKYPNWLGSTNPHNDDIVKMFGNQGGY